ncbi:P-loop containing nucleoside triphosphate hydrolase protein [Cubamyces menziesii]|uniref:AAA+ ATPase domain-containing protein n=1 Tax=Trametes cubensis TaxID=1111947 RepID=A0AAD7X6D4_9APHY|nr:P-loop containing nucleoside triphosphate hydrolase protein [Cubamyces menziesii]KAJ8469958.1 hypothetical protein ONZ51_g8643 [Trametes cubensis]
MATCSQSPPPNVETAALYLDHILNPKTMAWDFQETSIITPAELYDATNATPGAHTTSETASKHCLSLVRKMPSSPSNSIKFSLVINSPHLLRVCEKVIGDSAGVSWNAKDVELKPEDVIRAFPGLLEYRRNLPSSLEDPGAGAYKTEGDSRALADLDVLIGCMEYNFGKTLSRIGNLTAHGEITFDLLYAILAPGSIVLGTCSSTGKPRAYRLISAKLCSYGQTDFYLVECETLAAATVRDEGLELEDTAATFPTPAARRTFGMSQEMLKIRKFNGVTKINSLSVYPLEFHTDSAAMKAKLVKRGRRWAALNGVHHMQYSGIASRQTDDQHRMMKYSVKSRIMIDRAAFLQAVPSYENIPTPTSLEDISPGGPTEMTEVTVYQDENKGAYTCGQGLELPLTDEELLLASPILYGFSFTEKLWMEFDVENVSPIVWSNEAFDGLVLAAGRKDMLRSLVEAHTANSGFDDIIRGKGQGLVINLFGPPGVGKTLSAEATSEHLRRPLYILDSGDLGTDPSALNEELTSSFELAAHWKAILLIDEADVFLEKRSMHDMLRNAMVAVFLRQIEYYRGILFLTTNRITTFDDAFLSRIHIALHFTELTAPAKMDIWRTFIRKADADQDAFTDDIVAQLSTRAVNGRQIKNVCHTAGSLARSRGEKLKYEHLVDALDALEEFQAQFAAMRSAC